MATHDDDPLIARFRRCYAVTPIERAGILRLKERLRSSPERRGPRWHSVLAVAAVAALVVLAVRTASGPPPIVDDSTVTVRFALTTKAERVSVVGDFNGWDPAATPMTRETTSDRWQAFARVGVGRVEYAFVVDGQAWIPDPHAPLAPVSEFGARNSVLTVHSTGPL